MSYQVVFDASQKGYDWWWLAAPLVFAICLYLAWRLSRYYPLSSRFLERYRAYVLWLVIVLGSFIFICGFLFSFANHINGQQVFRQGNTQVVEGVVADFTPQPQFDHDVESFTVNGIKFEYSAAEVTPGFNQTSTHGGPINRNGLHVRIHYYHDTLSNSNVIMKLELAR